MLDYTKKTSNFNALRIKLASPKDIRTWSYGEVIKPETINYRTQKPEKDGLFCEKIFGPSKDWECYCGKYKKIRYKGIVCDKCGVEVTRSIVRRERMGHIDLSASVSHIWFLRGVPSKIGLVLDLSIQNLEKVVYFASFIIIKVDENLKRSTLEQLKQEYKNKKKQIESNFSSRVQEIKTKKTEDSREISNEVVEGELVKLNEAKDQKLQELEDAFSLAQSELKELRPLKIISEHTYQDLSLKYGHVFEANIGAEAIRALLENIDLDQLADQLEKETKSVSGSKREKLVRRLKLIKSLKLNDIRPEWMILKVIPVIPPDLRPMVALDGGRYATSDLNDLYRRVINRNNRLKQLNELNAPEVICRNEKRMLQEAVDALIDNSARHGKTVVASTGQKRMLKSIADMLKGKQGRFRQNLLGKRVDYSGRSVIVAGSHLKLYQCGLPKRMALELFKPFILSRLIKDNHVHNVRSASRFVEEGKDVIWDILEDIVKDAYVLLNRAPTLHRLGIQAFKPILIEGKAIQIHPMVCSAFNADFDGDQMAVHIPLTEEAVREAKEIMLAKNNLLRPADGSPITTPNQDIVWGCYYLTLIPERFENIKEEKIKIFSSPEEAIMSYKLRYLHLQEKIKVRIKDLKKKERILITSSVGRLIFNQALPEKVSYQNNVMDKKSLGKLVKSCLEVYGTERTCQLLDDFKDLGFKYLTRSGLSWGMEDLPDLPLKKEIIKKAEEEVDEVRDQYEAGLLTEGEKYSKTVSIWSRTKDDVVEIGKAAFDKQKSVFSMVDSGARGSFAQLTQIVGMKGLVINPAGEIIALPVKSSFKEGFDVLEYFISTHGARKGLSDTALRTASAGYLTRRMVDVCQDMVIHREDCKDTEGFILTQKESEEMGTGLVDRLMGRVVLDDVKDPKTNKVIVKKGDLVTEEKYRKLHDKNINQVKIRSLLTCKAIKGICQKCYGYDLAKNKVAELGTAIGIIAAQSIGEPGTQLTMRTFHTGGIAGKDITQGLPRVEELFEARPPRRKAVISDVAGIASIETSERVIEDASGKVLLRGASRQKILKISYTDIEELEYKLPVSEGRADVKIKVKDGDKVAKADVLFINKEEKEIKTKREGTVKIEKDKIKVLFETAKVKEFIIPPGYTLWVKDGDLVNPGDQLTEGSLDLQQIYRLKGKEFVQKYLIKEIQYIYSSQGQKLNDKHVELIARQMFSRVYVKKAGDTNLLPGEIVEKAELMEENNRMASQKGELAEGEELLLGITKVSLSTRSFLSAASFQETSRVLINAAITGRVDKLEGLKENVIIGRLIPVGTGFKSKKKAI